LTPYAELAEIEGEDDFLPPGRVAASWAETRPVGSAKRRHAGRRALIALRKFDIAHRHENNTAATGEEPEAFNDAPLAGNLTHRRERFR
jgi:hypothetical protein